MDEKIKTSKEAVDVIRSLIGLANGLTVSGYQNNIAVVALVNDLNRLGEWATGLEKPKKEAANGDKV